MQSSLNDIMEFDHVIFVSGDGQIHEDFDEMYAPEVYVALDEDGQISADAEVSMIDDVIGQGWDLLSGWTGQYRYNGAIMHDSEYIGGGLAAHIRENPGFYVAVVVMGMPYDEDDEYEPVGWAVAHQSVD